MSESPPLARVEWLGRQMYSRAAPINRDEIFAAYTCVFEALVGEPAGEAEKIKEEEVAGIEWVGYWAAYLTYRITAGDAALKCYISPIMASMGVSGEYHSWWTEGLDPIKLKGSVRYSARSPGHAELQLEGVDEQRAADLAKRFSEAFPPILESDELEREIEKNLGR